MALRDQPYIPLYVQDIMTDEKLNECSAATHGIYIKGLMCLMHKQAEYGVILLKQKYKQTSRQSRNFAMQIDKHVPYSVDELEAAIEELLAEGVLYIEGDKLCQKRMIRDNRLSEIRAKSGKKGGLATANARAKGIAKSTAKTEYVYENEIDIKEGGMGGDIAEGDINALMVYGFGRPVSEPEGEYIRENFLKRFEWGKVVKIFQQARLDRFNKITTLWEALDEEGNIKKRSSSTGGKVVIGRIR